ncbi:hypothetical protein BMR11_16440 [Methylococcaceae bacterium CS5]|nr:hypothetical protein BMR11_16440 [Methylococcaceae bacterium CS5]
MILDDVLFHSHGASQCLQLKASRLSRDTQYYGLKRQGGTTASKRFFEQDFSGLFSWVLGQMGELPLPRNGRPKVVLAPLKLLVSRLRREARSSNH